MTLPPAFDAHPLIQLVRWMREPFRLLEEGQARYGDAFTLRLPPLPKPMVVVADPEAVRDVFALGADEAYTGEANAILKPVFGDHSLLLLDGAAHTRHRKLMLPAFHGERMHAHGRAMLEIASDSIDRIPVGRPFPLLGLMQTITLDIILRSVFGVGRGPRHAEFARDLLRLADAGTSPMRMLGGLILLPLMQYEVIRDGPLGRFMGLATRAEAIIRDEIRRGREQGTNGRSDLLATMLEARDDGGDTLGDDEIHDEVLTLLLAGYETTATSLAWAMRWIIPDRSLTMRLAEEIASAGGDPVKLGKLQLLDATIKESMRLQPAVVNVARVLQQPTKLGHIELPAGTLVAPAVYLVHRRPSLYPEPSTFRPERFLGWKPAPWEWLPFGGGLRRCIGAQFALYEMKMVLAALLPRVEMQLATAVVRPVRRAVTITPSDGLPVLVTAKR
jgi:cytochrome P450